MSWYTKVAWTEGLFLRPHHFQQNDRYHEHLLESRVRVTTPYPWGFSHLEIDRDLAQQSKFALRRVSSSVRKPSSTRLRRCASKRKSTSHFPGWVSNFARLPSPDTSASASPACSKSVTSRSCSTKNTYRPCFCAAPTRLSQAGSTAWSAGSTTSSMNWRVMPPTPPPAAGCRASTISFCNS